MRIRLRLALLAIAALLSVGLIACGDDDDGGGGAQTTDARTLLKKAFASPAESGDLRLKVSVDLDGGGVEGPIGLTLTGPFESRGDASLPKADWDVSVNAGGLAFQGGIKLTDDNAYLEFQGDAYELGNLISKVPEDAREEGFLENLGFDPASWLDDPKVEDGQDIGGDSTRRVKGAVNVEKVVRDVLGALDSPELKRDLGPAGDLISPPELSEEDFDKMREAVDQFDFEANVDEDDKLRRILMKAKFDVPSDAGVGDLQGGTITIDYVLEKVGGEVDVEAPSNPQPIGQLLQKFGITDPFGLTERQ